MNQETLRESATLTPDPASGKGIWRVCLIEADIQGSSGYYPADVLIRDGATAFPSGTHIYFDHPTETEEAERPERSVRDLAGYLLDDAAFEDGKDGKGLFSRVQFTENARSLVQELNNVIGLSIRAAGQIEETPSGRIVRQISEGLSVDLVTRAGAGGRLVTMTESAAPESPPVEQTATTTAPAAVTSSIPSTIGTGALVNEVASLKESVGDRLDQLSVDVTRMAAQLKEAQSEAARQARENQKLAEAISFLKEKAENTEQKMKEAQNVGQVIAELLEAKLPVPSMIRLAQTYRPDQDLHESITHEREYLKKVLRESERGALTADRESTSNLGLTESASGSYSSTSDADLAEIRNLLSGGTY
jgi:outer membrane murein-binding lipoprotein Lpp